MLTMVPCHLVLVGVTVLALTFEPSTDARVLMAADTSMTMVG